MKKRKLKRGRKFLKLGRRLAKFLRFSWVRFEEPFFEPHKEEEEITLSPNVTIHNPRRRFEALQKKNHKVPTGNHTAR